MSELDATDEVRLHVGRHPLESGAHCLLLWLDCLRRDCERLGIIIQSLYRVKRLSLVPPEGRPRWYLQPFAVFQSALCIGFSYVGEYGSP